MGLVSSTKARRNRKNAPVSRSGYADSPNVGQGPTSPFHISAHDHLPAGNSHVAPLRIANRPQRREFSENELTSGPSHGPSIFRDTNHVTTHGGNWTVVGGTTINRFYSSQENATVLKELVNWLSPVNFRTIQKDLIEQKVPDTGLWFVESELFRRWLGHNGAVIWATGMPGAGKTFLACTVIHYLQEFVSHSSNCSVVFAYCRYSELMSVRDILAALLRQLLERHPHLLPLVEPMYAQHELDMTKPSQSELLQLLSRLSRQFSISFFVLDGIDEAPPDSQFDLVEATPSIQGNFFMTSRPLGQLQYKLPNATFFEVTAQNRDIALLVAHQFRHLFHLQTLLEPKDVTEWFISILQEKSQGMFLHASLQVKSLSHCLTLKDLRNSLVNSSPTVEDMYSSTIARILNHPNHTADRSIRILSWVAHACTSLTLEELRYALAFSPEEGIFDEDDLMAETSIVPLCLGLVTVDVDTKKARLVHYTAQRIIPQLLQETLHDPDGLCADTCIALLTAFQIHTSSARHDLASCFHPHPLLEYAYNFWHTHANRAVPNNGPANPLQGNVINFIRMCSSYPIRPSETIDDLPIESMKQVDHLGPLHVAALYGFLEVLPVFLEGDNAGSGNSDEAAINARSRLGSTALSLAAANGQDEVVRFILVHPDAEVNTPDGQGELPLILAVSGGHEGVVQALLVSTLVDTNKADRWGRTALFRAITLGYEAITMHLLGSSEIEVNLTDRDKRTPLMLASERGLEEVVQRLLSIPETKVDAADGEGRTALMLAVLAGQEGVLQDLVAHEDPGVNKTDASGGSALSYAIQGGSLSIVRQILLRPDLEVNRYERELEAIPLIWAAMHGYSGLVSELLHHPNIQPNLLDAAGKTALIWAIRGRDDGSGDTDEGGWKVNFGRTAQVLLDFPGIEVDVADDTGKSAMDYAYASLYI
ncbi:hypothetical protein BKA70DRAFT_1183842 [Coprinopsis sp. MPI-PUGE-AT-0042]|nr:hypothetical protein BKA70DRAFT_1183842 [Coprinopsis sp. MPI-PUGE-AT-0042]